MDEILKIVDDLLDGVTTSDEAYMLYEEMTQMTNKFYERYEVLMGLEEDE